MGDTNAQRCWFGDHCRIGSHVPQQFLRSQTPMLLIGYRSQHQISGQRPAARHLGERFHCRRQAALHVIAATAV